MLTSRRGWLLGVTAIVTMVWTVPLAMRAPSPVEVSASEQIVRLPDWVTPPLVVVMQGGTRSAIILVALVLWLANRRRSALAVFAAGWTAWAATVVLKEVVARPRPDVGSLGAPIRESASGFGYPSSHAAIAGAVVCSVCLTSGIPRIPRLALAAMAGGVAVARVHVGAHWVLDVIGGLAVGVFVAQVYASVLGSRSR